jgi:site-specific DNA recombinase
MERTANVAALRAEHARNDREIEKLIGAIADGIDPMKVNDRINGLSARQTESETQLADTKDEPVPIHPRMSDRYHGEV